MFLYHLTDPQREAFLSLAARLVSVDTFLRDSELSLLTQMREEMGIASTWNPSGEPDEALIARFDTPRSRAVALLELLWVGHVDGEHAVAEQLFVQKMAEDLGFTYEELDEMESWVRRYHSLLAEGEALIGARPPGTGAGILAETLTHGKPTPREPLTGDQKPASTPAAAPPPAPPPPARPPAPPQAARPAAPPPAPEVVEDDLLVEIDIDALIADIDLDITDPSVKR